MVHSLTQKNLPISFKALHSEVQSNDNVEEQFLGEPSLITLDAMAEMIDFFDKMKTEVSMQSGSETLYYKDLCETFASPDYQENLLDLVDQKSRVGQTST